MYMSSKDVHIWMRRFPPKTYIYEWPSYIQQVVSAESNKWGQVSRIDFSLIISGTSICAVDTSWASPISSLFQREEDSLFRERVACTKCIRYIWTAHSIARRVGIWGARDGDVCICAAPEYFVNWGRSLSDNSIWRFLGAACIVRRLHTHTRIYIVGTVLPTGARYTLLEPEQVVSHG